MSDYKVGHGKPPKATQFKPGASGNPKGRPKGASNASGELYKLLATSISFSQNGKPTKMTPVEIAFKSLVASAAKGNINAIKLLVQLAKDQPSTAAELVTANSSFDLTSEEMENISKELLLKDKT